MSTVGKWWQRCEGWLAPGAMLLFLIVGLQIGIFIESSRLSKQHAQDLAAVTEKFTRDLAEKDNLIKEKDRRVRKINNIQIATQRETSEALKVTTEAVKSIAESAKISAKSASDAAKKADDK